MVIGCIDGVYQQGLVIGYVDTNDCCDSDNISSKYRIVTGKRRAPTDKHSISRVC